MGMYGSGARTYGTGITKEHPQTARHGSQILRFPVACTAVEAGTTTLCTVFLRTASGTSLASRAVASVFGVCVMLTESNI
jgi:hypothetical protein